MAWVRLHPFVANWPGGGPPPVFEINSNENGTAVIELAWDPQALLNPGTYSDLLRYYSSAGGLSGSITTDRGGTMAVNVPAQTITLAGNRATWQVPQPLWDAYVEESLKTIGPRPTSSFSRNLYYRVRLTPPGASTSEVWPSDKVLGSQNITVPPPDDSGRIDPAAAMSAPHIGILAMSATPASGAVPDAAAIDAAGGLPPFLPKLYSQMLTWFWNGLPEADPNRMSLVAIFAHQGFKSLAVPERGQVLKLWLLSSKARSDIPTLLARQVATGSGVLTPITRKTALKGGKTLLTLLLELMEIHIHPDITVMTREELVADVLKEILDPNGRTNQGAAGTCVPTSIQTMLININPAEYVRLQIGWLSSAAKAELANGATATVPRAVLQTWRYLQPGAPSSMGFHARTYSELAFQAAGLKFAKAANFVADSGDEAGAKAIFKFVHENGLFSDEAKRLMDALFNVNFTVSALVPINVPATVGVQAAITTTLINDIAVRPGQILLAIYWNTDPRKALPTGVKSYSSHAVVAMRRDGGRIFFKNPQYAGSIPLAANGMTAAAPPRRYENASSTLESITDADLGQWILWYLRPDTAII
jgi:hypothetical protein